MTRTRWELVVNTVTGSLFAVSVLIPVLAPTSGRPKPLVIFAVEWATGVLITSPFDIHSVFDYSFALSLLSVFLAMFLLHGLDFPQKALASISVPIAAIAAYEFIFQALNWMMFRQPQFIFEMPYLPIFLAWLAMAANFLPYSRTTGRLPLLFLLLMGSAFGVWMLEGFHQIYSGDYVLAWAMNVLSKASMFGFLVSRLAVKRM